MNEFDQFVKHELGVKNYARYTDDFIIVSENKKYLIDLLPIMQRFLAEKLKLTLHPKKISLRKYHEGIDFLGYIIFPHYQLIRLKTKKRILKKIREKAKSYRNNKISENNLSQSIQSYLGVLSHADTYKLTKSLKNQLWYWMKE